MFLDLLDTSRTSENYYKDDECRRNAVQGESMLLYLLLSGQTPTLTQTQIIDSNIVHSILQTKESKDYFLSLIRNGEMHLALHTGSGAKSMQDYFKKSLSYGLDNAKDFFDFSTLPFLKNYDVEVRKNLHLNIIKALEHNSYQFKTDGVSNEDIDFISMIIENIQDVDRAIRGRFIYTKGFGKHIDDLVRNQCTLFIHNVDTEPTFAKLSQEVMVREDFGNRRSLYYQFLKNRSGYYSNDQINQMKQVVDNCYIEAVASSIPGDGYSLNFSNKFSELVPTIEQSAKILRKEILEIKPSNTKDYITWETLTRMLKEVNQLQAEKSLNRIDALNEYKRTQSYKPIVKVAKYLGLTALTSVIPGIPNVVEIVSDLVTGAASDIAGEGLKKPSLREIGQSIKESKNKTKLVDHTIQFISMTTE